jgi:hypothetical protein
MDGYGFCGRFCREKYGSSGFVFHKVIINAN